MSNLTISHERLAELQQEGVFKGKGCPPCPDCGRPMVGKKTEEGAWCPTCKVESDGE